MAAEIVENSASKECKKSAAAFRTISEVSKALDLPQHVLRFWETKFSNIRPLKRGGGRRYYRPEDMKLLQRIRDLLYTEGYTIKGVQKLLRQNALKDNPIPTSSTEDSTLDDFKRTEIKSVLTELEDLRDILHKAHD